MTNRIQNFIDELNIQIGTNLQKIDFQFNTEYGWPEFDPLRDEICKCLICDFCQASITLTNHLLENFLKTMLIYHETVANNDNSDGNILYMFKPNVDKFDGLDLSQTLGRAKGKGLITKKQWKVLDDYRDNYRNAYSHAEKKKIFKDLTIATNVAELKDNELKTSDYERTPIIDVLSGQGIAQTLLSKRIGFDYFISVDTIIRDVIVRFKNIRTKQD